MTTTRSSNLAAGLRTTALMAALGGLLVVIGYAIGGIGVAGSPTEDDDVRCCQAGLGVGRGHGH